MNKQQDEWEKEFDEEKQEWSYYDEEDTYVDWELVKKYISTKFISKKHLKEVLDDEVLFAYRDELVGDGIDSLYDEPSFLHGYNQALSDLSKKLDL